MIEMEKPISKYRWKRWILVIIIFFIVLGGGLLSLVFNRFYFSNQDFPRLAQWQGNDKSPSEFKGSRPEIIGHRGSGLPAVKNGQALLYRNRQLLIGNTAIAIKQGIEAGTDWIEIDIRKTSDNQLVIFHDESIDLKTTGSGKIEKLSLEDTQQVKLLLDPPESILTLDKVFEKFHTNQRKWIFDIKAVGMQEAILAWIDSKVAQGELVENQFILFGRYEVLCDYVESGYRLGYILNWGGEEGVSNRFNVLFDYSKIMSQCEELSSTLLVLPTIFSHNSLVETANSKGIVVWLYGSDNIKDHLHAVSRSISGVIVDQPEDAFESFLNLGKEKVEQNYISL